MNPRELLHALRLFRRTPTATTVALLSIAITVGATAVVFTAVRSVLIAPLPYLDAGHLVQLRTEYKLGKSQADWVAWSDMQDLAHIPGRSRPSGSITTPFSIFQPMEACRLRRYMA